MAKSRIRYPDATRDDAEGKLHVVIYKEVLSQFPDVGPWFIDTKDDEGGFGPYNTEDFPTWEEAMAAVPAFYTQINAHNVIVELMELIG